MFKSIYAGKDLSKFADQIATYSMEVQMCEDLISMGFNNSNGIDLNKHIKTCNDHINVLESAKKHH
jgi:hypothetical protein